MKLYKTFCMAMLSLKKKHNAVGRVVQKYRLCHWWFEFRVTEIKVQLEETDNSRG